MASEERVASGQWSVASESEESGQPMQEEGRSLQNVQNEANPESTQSSLPLDVESAAAEPAGRKRSQFTQAVASGERQCHVGQAFEPDVSLERLTYPHEKSSSTGPAFPGG